MPEPLPRADLSCGRASKRRPEPRLAREQPGARSVINIRHHNNALWRHVLDEWAREHQVFACARRVGFEMHCRLGHPRFQTDFGDDFGLAWRVFPEAATTNDCVDLRRCKKPRRMLGASQQCWRRATICPDRRPEYNRDGLSVGAGESAGFHRANTIVASRSQRFDFRARVPALPAVERPRSFAAPSTASSTAA